MRVRNYEMLVETGEVAFPKPFERVVFNAPNIRIDSPTRRSPLTVSETGVLLATIKQPMLLTTYAEILQILFQLKGEDESLDTLAKQTSSLRTRVLYCLDGEKEFDRTYQVLKAVKNKGYILLDQP